MSSNDYGIEAKDHGPTLKEMWPGYALNSAITVINLLLGLWHQLKDRDI